MDCGRVHTSLKPFAISSHPMSLGYKKPKYMMTHFRYRACSNWAIMSNFSGKNLIMAWRNYRDKNLFLYKKAFQPIAAMRSEDLSMRAMILMANILMCLMAISRKAKIASMKPNFR